MGFQDGITSAPLCAGYRVLVIGVLWRVPSMFPNVVPADITAYEEVHPIGVNEYMLACS